MHSHYHKIRRTCLLIAVRRDNGAVEVVATDPKPSVLAELLKEIDTAVYATAAISRNVTLMAPPKRFAEPEACAKKEKQKKEPKEPKVEAPKVEPVVADEPVIEPEVVITPAPEAELNLG